MTPFPKYQNKSEPTQITIILPSFRDSCDIFRGVFDRVLLGVFEPFSLLDWARDSPSLSDPILDLAL